MIRKWGPHMAPSKDKSIARQRGSDRARADRPRPRPPGVEESEIEQLSKDDGKGALSCSGWQTKEPPLLSPSEPRPFSPVLRSEGGRMEGTRKVKERWIVFFIIKLW